MPDWASLRLAARAERNDDPLAGNLIHTEEQWAGYSNASPGGTNRPGTRSSTA